MALDGCGAVCKCILMFLNVIFAVLGLASLGLGLWLRVSPNTSPLFEISALDSSAFVTAVTVLIAIGLVLLILVSFGDVGVCKERKWALEVYSAFLAILAIAVVVVGVLAYSEKDQVSLRIVELYSSLYVLYMNGGDPVIGVTLIFIHKMLNCCGVTGIPLLELAQSTCPNRIIMHNCPGVIADVFDSKAPLVMGIFIGTGSLLVIALICSIILRQLIRQSTSSPQYIILTQPNSVLANYQPPQDEFVSTSYSHPDQDPVVFTPLTVANIPLAQITALVCSVILSSMIKRVQQYSSDVY